MTTSSTKRKERCNCSRWTKIIRNLDNAKFSYYYYQCEECQKVMYPPSEAQRLIEYSNDNLFFFVEDWILVWMYSVKEAPVAGIVALQKQILIVTHEFAVEENIISENPGFIAYKYGPFAERIDDAINTLMMSGLVLSYGSKVNTKGERFILTAKGEKVAKNLYAKLTEHQQNALVELRLDLQQLTTEGVVRRVYRDELYRKYIDESTIYKRILRRERPK